MHNLLIGCLVVFLFSSCGGPMPDNKRLTYQNIIILSDMSDRLRNLPAKDTAEILKLLRFFRDECVKPGEKIGDKSSILFSTFSEKVSCSIDINRIKDLGEKQRFINCTGEYQQTGLNHQIENFKTTVGNVYDTTNNKGLDLISLLIEKISNEPIVKKDTFLTNGVDTTFLQYDNNIYIFTDGYLEYFEKSKNNQFYFSNPEMDSVRKYCSDNNVSLLQALEANESLCLPAYPNPTNKHIQLHILETHEHDKDLILNTYRHTTGLRDNEILEAVWRKWAKDSGFKGDITWSKY